MSDDGTVPLEDLLRDAIAGSGLFAAANVIMQLARLPVGRGVAESTVDSGRVELHPVKRARTTDGCRARGRSCWIDPAVRGPGSTIHPQRCSW